MTAVLPDGRRLVREVQAGQQLPLVRGSARPFRARAGGDGDGADRALPERPRDAPSRDLRQPPRHRARGAVAARRAACPHLRGRSVARSGTRPSSTRFGATCPRRPRMPGTSSISRPRCGTRGRPTTAAPTATSSREKHRAADVQAARETAISYAAYRILLWRYAQGAGLQTTFDALTATMTSLCLRPGLHERQGQRSRRPREPDRRDRDRGGPARRLARARSATWTRRYRAVNEPLVVAQPGATMHDPVFWQPLALDQIIAQNGIAVPGRVQSFIGAGWGHVRGFALPASHDRAPDRPGQAAVRHGRLRLLQAGRRSR